jgi:hypothetical protein
VSQSTLTYRPRSVHEEARTVAELLIGLRTATQAGIEAIRDADSSALESALDQRSALLSQSGPAILALSLVASATEGSHLVRLREELEVTMRLAAEVQLLDSRLHVALSAVQEQVQTDLRLLDQADAHTARYRPAERPHGSAVNLTG